MYKCVLYDIIIIECCNVERFISVCKLYLTSFYNMCCRIINKNDIKLRPVRPTNPITASCVELITDHAVTQPFLTHIDI